MLQIDGVYTKLRSCIGVSGRLQTGSISQAKKRRLLSTEEVPEAYAVRITGQLVRASAELDFFHEMLVRRIRISLAHVSCLKFLYCCQK